MRIKTALWLGVHACLVGGIALVTANHVEQHADDYARFGREARACDHPNFGMLPRYVRCTILRVVKYNPPEVIAAVAWQESRFDPKICSRTKTGKIIACGIMQFVQGTADAYKVDRFDVLSSFEGGDKYLADLTRQFGNVGLALAAYNCGPGCVASYLKGKRTLPKETTDYVLAITGHHVNYWRLHGAKLRLAGHVERMKGEF